MIMNRKEINDQIDIIMYKLSLLDSLDPRNDDIIMDYIQQLKELDYELDNLSE